MSRTITLLTAIDAKRLGSRWGSSALLAIALLCTQRLASAEQTSDFMRTLTDDQLVEILEQTQISAINRGTTNAGDTLLKLKVFGKDVGVVHDAKLKQLQFVVMMSDTERLFIHKLFIANEWNRQQQGPRAVIIKEKLWALALDLNYRHGVSAGRIAATLRRFSAAIPPFVHFVGDDGVNPVEVDSTSRSDTKDKVSIDSLRKAFQRAGATEFSLGDADANTVTFRVRIDEKSLTVVHHRRSGQLSLRYRHQVPGTITEELLQRANSWNLEPAVGRALLNEMSLSDDNIVFWDLYDYFPVTEDFPADALVGFIREFLAVTPRFRAYATGDNNDVPELAEVLRELKPTSPEQQPPEEMTVTRTPTERPIVPTIERVAGEKLKSLWLGILSFRNMCAMEGQKGWQQFAAASVATEMNELSDEIWEQLAPIGWSFFFSRSVFCLGKPTGPNPVVGFFHPWSDVWVITQWDVAEKPRIIKAELLTGEWVRRRGQPPFNLEPDWLRREGNPVEQLVRATVENVDFFESIANHETPWEQSLQLVDRDAELAQLDRSAAAMQLIDSWSHALALEIGDAENDKVGRLRKEGRRFLMLGSKGEIKTLTAEAAQTHPRVASELAAFPKDVFVHLRPQYWLADANHAILFFVPDKNPDLFLSLSYEERAEGLQLRRIDLLHFSLVAQLQRQRAGQLSQLDRSEEDRK